MEPVQFFSMVNNFDEETKVNLKKMLYENEERSEASNIGENIQFIGGAPALSRD